MGGNGMKEYNVKIKVVKENDISILAKNRKEAVTRKWWAEKILKMKKDAVRSGLRKPRQSEKAHQLFLILWKVDALFR